MHRAQHKRCDICLHEMVFSENGAQNKWSFPLRITSVNVTKSEVSCGFGHI